MSHAQGPWLPSSPLLAELPLPRPLRLLARFVLGAFVVLLAALVLVPWQQTATGKGRVVAFAPTERKQTIEAPIEGRVARWYVTEGQRVNAGDPIVDIRDNDPDFVERLQRENEAVVARVAAANARLTAIRARITALELSQNAAQGAADARTVMGDERRKAARVAVLAAKAQQEAAALNLERQRALFAKGLTAKRALETAEVDAVRAQNDWERAKTASDAAEAEVLALTADRQRVTGDGTAALAEARANLAVASAEQAAASAEQARIETRIARQANQHVRATARGTVMRVTARQPGDMVKPGDVLAQFVPDTEERAVELWVDGNDINLVRLNAVVRLQFEGWPSFQLSGWPTTALGTFSGRVSFIDTHDDGAGRFRVVVTPGKPNDWPKAEYLRQGSLAAGWVLLEEVRLGYEVWRILNGFPAEWIAPVTALDKSPEKP